MCGARRLLNASQLFAFVRVHGSGARVSSMCAHVDHVHRLRWESSSRAQRRQRNTGISRYARHMPDKQARGMALRRACKACLTSDASRANRSLWYDETLKRRERAAADLSDRTVRDSEVLRWNQMRIKSPKMAPFAHTGGTRQSARNRRIVSCARARELWHTRQTDEVPKQQGSSARAAGGCLRREHGLRRRRPERVAECPGRRRCTGWNAGAWPR